jgi:hypothetical protein
MNLIMNETKIDIVDDKLITLLNENMNSDEQKQFVESFKIYLQYGYDDSKFIIDFDDIWKWVGFTTKGNAKRLLTTKFFENINYVYQKGLSLKINSINKDEKEIILLNVSTFKKFCMTASTKRADDICNYYLKMEKIMHQYTKDMLIEAKQNYETTQNKLLQTITDNTNKIENDRHNILLESNSKKDVVYVLKIIVDKFITTDEFIIKIGKTSDIRDRVNKLSSYFACSIYVLDVFVCEDNYKFEQYLHNHPKILQYKYKEIINNDNTSTETYLMKSDNHYKQIKNIILKNIKFYKNNYNAENKIKLEEILLKKLEYQLQIEQIELKKEEIKLKNKLCDIYSNDKDKIENIIRSTFINTINNDVSRKIIEPINEIIESINEIIDTNEEIIDTNKETEQEETEQEETEEETKEETKKYYGPYVQVYDKDDLKKLLFMYQSVTDATRNIEDTSFTQIKFAARNKLVYKNYRWHLVDRTENNPNEIRDIGTTVYHKEKKKGFIATLNEEKTEILKVFANQKDVGEHFGQHPSAICTALRFNTKVNNNYIYLWDNCENSLQDKYLSKNALPIINSNSKRGFKIQKINEKNEVVETYNSISDLCKKCNVSPKTIKKYADTDNIYNGYKWKFV